MAQVDPSDPKDVRRSKKDAKATADERAIVWTHLMGSKAGRSFVYDWMQRCHVFSNSFSSDPYRTAFACGEHNIGLQLLAELMHWCPDQYIQMMREANHKELSNGRSSPDADTGIDLDDPRGEFYLRDNPEARDN